MLGLDLRFDWLLALLRMECIRSGFASATSFSSSASLSDDEEELVEDADSDGFLTDFCTGFASDISVSTSSFFLSRSLSLSLLPLLLVSSVFGAILMDLEIFLDFFATLDFSLSSSSLLVTSGCKSSSYVLYQSL